jgi:hypothetical protein
MAGRRGDVAADTTRRYEVVVRGRLSAELVAALPRPTVVSDADLTRLGVTVADQSQLHDILDRLFAASVELVSLRQLREADTADGAAGAGGGRPAGD